MDDAEIAAASLHSLERKGFVRRQRRSSVEGESEFAFAHALVRDVAYGQIPRAERAAKHRAVAEWIESLGRPEDHAEMLAYHWRSALELAAASGDATADLDERTRLALSDAGDRAFGLNAFGPAVAYYDEALALWPAEAPGRAEVLFRKARALHVLGDDGQESALEEARDALLEIGDRETAGQAEAFLSRAAWYRGRGEEAQRHIERAQELVADAGTTVAKARVLCLLARLRMLSGEGDEAIRIGREALELAEALDLDELRIHALTTIGSARTLLEHTGDEELERALELAKTVNSPLAAVVLNNLSVLAMNRGELVRAEELMRATLDLAQQLGDRENIRFSHANLLFQAMQGGRWDETLANADRFIAECETSPHNMETAARETRAYVRFARGDAEGALEDWEHGLALARAMGSPERLIPALLDLGRGFALLGRLDEARAYVLEGMNVARANPALGSMLGRIASESDRLGVTADVDEIVSQAPAGPWKDVALAELRGERERAADTFRRMGAPAIEAEVRIGCRRGVAGRGPDDGGGGRAGEGAHVLPLGAARHSSSSAANALLAEAQERLMATPRRERKVVTVVFCDLVGFTSRAESMDPEDVEALSAPVPRRVSARSSSATAARSRSSSGTR